MQFETQIAAGERHSALNPFFTGRIQNALVQCLDRCVNIPKIILIILEDDLLKEFQDRKRVQDLESHIEIYLTAIVSNTRKQLEILTNTLPQFAKRDTWPKIVFIKPTANINYNNRYQRRLMANIMDKLAKRLEFWALDLKQIWDIENTNIFIKEENRFTAEGIRIFWQAVDRTVLYCDKRINKEDETASDKFLDNPSKPKNRLNDETSSQREGRATATRGASGSGWRRNNYAPAQKPAGYYERFYWQRK